MASYAMPVASGMSILRRVDKVDVPDSLGVIWEIVFSLNPDQKQIVLKGKVSNMSLKRYRRFGDGL